MASSPSPGYSITLRVAVSSSAGSTTDLASAVAETGAAMTALDIVESSHDAIVVDVTCNTVDEEHAEKISAVINARPGMTVRKVSDRTFLMHLGGKLSVEPKVALSNRDDLSRAYTPGVARVCLAIADNPEDARSLTIKRNTVAVVTDGTAVLGLGDIGPAAALPVMEGKAALFKQFADVDAWPVCLDTKDTEEIIMIVKAMAPVYGGINLEDIAAPRCFEIERRLRDELDIPVFHDDQHGTAIVVLAALINALRVVDKKMGDVKIVVSGVGAAGQRHHPAAAGPGRAHIVGVARTGAIHRGETYTDEHRTWIAENTNEEGFSGTLHEALVGADVFIGVSAPNLFGADQVATMAPDAIVLALANPDPEIRPVRPPSTPRSSPPDAATSPTRSTTCSPSRGSSAACSTPPPRTSPPRCWWPPRRRSPTACRRGAQCQLHRPQRLRPSRRSCGRRGGRPAGPLLTPPRPRETPHEHRDHRPPSHRPRRGDPHPRGPGLRGEAAPELRRPPRRAARGPRRQARSPRRREVAGLPAGDRRRADGDWQVAPAPPALQDRRVEMTGPASPAKMAINALNSGAKVWLADLEDASTPTWANVIDSILNLRDAARGTLSYSPADGQGVHAPHRRPAGRGGGPPARLAPARKAPARRRRGRGRRPGGLRPALLPRGQAAGRQRPRPVLLPAQDGEPPRGPAVERRLRLRPGLPGIPQGTIRATVLIETIPAAFEMEEILYELRDHASGLNAGRWDYLFSIIKYFRDAGPEFVLLDRAAITMTAPFMRAYTELLVKTCHKRGAFAMGGMAAVIPNRRDPEVTEAAFAKVSADKTREANDGFDGSWVAHPDLVPVCREVFDAVLGDKPNQLDKQRPEVEVTAAQLLDVASADGQVTEAGLRLNLYVAVAYTAVWLSGNGAVAIHNLMEDAATAEISRSQVWQQIRNKSVLADTGNTVTRELVARILGEETEKLRSEFGRAVPPLLQAGQRPDRGHLPVRGLHGLPDHAGLRAGQVSVLTASGGPRLDERVLAHIDAQLAATDACSTGTTRVTTAPASPCTPSTCPPTVSRVVLPQRWGAQAAARWPPTAAGRRSAGRSGSPTTGGGRRRARRGQAGRRTDRGPAAGLRGRLRGQGRRRRGRRRGCVAARLADALAAGAAPAFMGLRFKCFEAPTRRRGLRTLDLFLSSFWRSGELPDGLVLTFPRSPPWARSRPWSPPARLEESTAGLPAGRLGFEVQVETPQLILGPDGTSPVAAAARRPGRISGLHYGTYDYSASLQISAEYQSMEHPVADFAKEVMQLAVAGTGIRLSDGSTNIIPVGDNVENRLAAARPAGPAVAGAGHLPGLGPAPGPAAQPLRRQHRLLPAGPRPPQPGCGTT